MAIESLYATSVSSGAVDGSANALGSTSGTWTTLTGNTNWTCAFQMGDPSGALITANNTTITARVKKEAGQSGTPTAQIIVRSPTGNTIHTGATTNITSGTGQDLSVTFSQSLIGTNHNDVVVEIVAVSAGGSPSVRTTVQLDYIRWDADVVVTTPKSASETPSLAISDSGSVTVTGQTKAASDTGSLAVSESTDIQTFDITEKSANDTGGIRVYEASEMEPSGGGGSTPTVDNFTVTPGDAASPGAITGTLPSGTGDLLVAFVMYDNVLVTAPGWTIHDSRIVGGTADVGVTMLSAPSDVASLTFTPSDTGRAGVVVIYRISGSNGVHAAAGIGELGNVTNTVRAIPQVTTTVDNCLLISGVGSDGAGTNYTWDSPWAEQTDQGVTGDTGLRSSTATATQATAGTTPGGNVTLDVSDHHGISMVALSPAAGGPSGTHTESTWDASSISVSESTDIQVGGEPDPIAGSDTGSIAISESTDLQQFDFVEKSASDTGSIAVSESSDVTPLTPLPGDIEGIEPEAAGGRQGPIMDSNGNLYRVVEEFLADGNNPRMMKSSDGGATWAEVDAANAPEGSGAYNDMESAWITRRESHKEIVLAYMKSQSRWWGMSFRTSDHPTNPDTWDTGTFATSSGQDQFGTQASESGVAVVSHSDGKLMAFIRGEPQAGNQAFLFRTKATTSWDTGSTYITDSFDMTRPSAVITDNDTTYLFYRDHTNGRVYFRDISSSGTVFASTRVDTNGANTGDSYMNNIVPPVYYDDAGTHVCVVGFANGSNQLITVEVRGVSPQSEQTVSTNTLVVNPGTTDNQGPAAALAVHGTTVYAFWCDSADGNVYYSSRPNGGSWSARTLLDDTGTGNTVWWMHANKIVKPSGDIYIGYTYDVGAHADDGGNIKYNELFVASGSTPKAGSESNSLAVSETVTIDVQVSATDTGSISVSETQASDLTVDTTDSGSVASTETVQVDVALATTDTGSLSVSDASALLISDDLAGSDSAVISVTETATNAVTDSTSDTGSVTVAESTVQNVSVETTETVPLSVSESVQTDVQISTTDTGAVSVSESTQIILADEISTSDSGSIAVSESVVIDVSLAVSDTGSISATEATSFDNTASASDSSSIAVTETASVFYDFPGSDTGALQVSETSDVQTSGGFTPSASDSGAVSVSESVAVTVQVTASDGSALLVVETTDIQGQTTEIDATDTGSLSVSETTDVQTLATEAASDSGSLAVTEGTTLFVTVDASDGNSLAVTEITSGSATTSTTDTSSVALTETALADVTSDSSDSGALTLTETADITTLVEVSASDSASIAVADSGVAQSVTPPTVKAYHNGVWTTATVRVYVNGQWVVANTKVYRDNQTWI